MNLAKLGLSILRKKAINLFRFLQVFYKVDILIMTNTTFGHVGLRFNIQNGKPVDEYINKTRA